MPATPVALDLTALSRLSAYDIAQMIIAAEASLEEARAAVEVKL